MSGRKKERKKERKKDRDRERKRERQTEAETERGGGEAFIESDQLQINKLGPGRFRHGKCKRDRK